MSNNGRCRNTPKGGLNFKGIENFFKRIAFNLGNSPSQTEVKIISCIPIDVTDLQQKIARLEKQLEEARICRARMKPVCNTTVCDCAVKSSGLCCDVLDVCSHNYPCVPPHIYKCPKKKSIASLFCRSRCPSSRSTCDDFPCSMDPCASQKTIRCDNSFYIQPADSICNIDDCKPRCYRKKFFKKFKCKKRKPKTQCVYYARADSSPFNHNHKKVDEAAKSINNIKHSYLTNMIDKQYRAKPLGSTLSEISSFTSPVCRDSPGFNGNNTYESDVCSCFHQGFHNIDKYINKIRSPPFLRRNRLITQEEYYDSTLYDVVPVKEKPDKIKKALNRPYEKGYQSYIDINTSSNLSTSAVDKQVYKTYSHRMEPVTLKRSRRAPGHQIKKIMINSNKLKSQSYVDIEHSRNNQRTYNKRIITDNYLESTQSQRRNATEYLVTVGNRKLCPAGIDNKNLKLSKRENTIDQIKNILQSVLQEVKSSAISKSSKYHAVKNDTHVPKDESLNNRSETSGYGNMSTHLQNNTKNVHGNVAGNCQGNIQNNKFGQTIRNQSSYMTSSFSDSIPVNMQVPAQMQGSRLLNSFTYSPYNTNLCMESSSNNSYYYPSPPLRYVQNYPVFVHNPRGCTCAFCYTQHNAHLKSHNNKQATTIATNTEKVNDECIKEGNKFIKELYISMPLNMSNDKKDDLHSKDNNAQDIDNLQMDKSIKIGGIIPEPLKEKKKEEEKSEPLKENNRNTNDVHDISELYRKKDMQFSSESRNIATDSRQESIDVSIRSYRVNKDVIKNNHGKRLLNNLINLAMQSKSEESQVKEETLSTTHDTTSSDITQTETEDKSKKQGLFKRMFKSIKIFTRRVNKSGHKKVGMIDNMDLSSEYNDYRTAYNLKVEKPVRPIARLHYLPKCKTQSKKKF